MQENIGAFGGDHTRVMIHGCSAGGVSISNHLVAPLSWPFFTAAGMESGNQFAFQDAVSMADAQKSYDGLLAGFGCSDLACLLTKNTTELLHGHAAHAAPVVDGVNLADFPKALLLKGKVKPVPTIVGSCRDELATLEHGSFTQYSNMTESGFREWVAQNYGEANVQLMLELYPVSSVSARVGPSGRGPCSNAPADSDGGTAYYYLVETIASDDALVCTSRNVAELLPEGMAYQYSFAFGSTMDKSRTTNFVGHCSQTSFEFGNGPIMQKTGGGAPAMGSLMSAFWANLAKSGSPNGGAADSLPKWSAYTAAADESFVFAGSAAGSGMRPNKKRQCDFLRRCRGNGTESGRAFGWGGPGQLCDAGAR